MTLRAVLQWSMSATATYGCGHSVLVYAPRVKKPMTFGVVNTSDTGLLPDCCSRKWCSHDQTKYWASFLCRPLQPAWAMGYIWAVFAILPWSHLVLTTGMCFSPPSVSLPLIVCRQFRMPLQDYSLSHIHGLTSLLCSCPFTGSPLLTGCNLKSHSSL